MMLQSKAIAAISSVDGEKFGPNGGFTAILSTPSEDRDGDRLLSKDWITPLPDRLPLDIDHGMSVADTVGSFHPYFDGDVLMMDAYFASTPQAQHVRTLVNEGHISTVSVAFMTHKDKKSAGEPFRELLNAGVVNTPSNRDAVILQSKGMDLAEFERKLSELLGIKSVEISGETVQHVHDMAVEHGAECTVSDEDSTGEDDGANKAAALRLRLKYVRS